MYLNIYNHSLKLQNSRVFLATYEPFKRGIVVELLEQLGYDADSCRKA